MVKVTDKGRRELERTYLRPRGILGERPPFMAFKGKLVSGWVKRILYEQRGVQITIYGETGLRTFPRYPEPEAPDFKNGF